MELDEFVPGVAIAIRASMKDVETDEPIDPPIVRAYVKPPTGARVEMDVTQLGPGEYRAVTTTTADEGIWHYRFEGTGPEPAADEGAFYVSASTV